MFTLLVRGVSLALTARAQSLALCWPFIPPASTTQGRPVLPVQVNVAALTTTGTLPDLRAWDVVERRKGHDSSTFG